MAVDNPNREDSSSEILFICIAIVMAFSLIWFFFHVYIIKAYLGIWSVQAYIAGFFTDKFASVPAWISSVDPETLGFWKFAKAANVMGEMTNLITAFILGAVAIYVHMKSPYFKFTKRHTTQTLMLEAVKEWPQISPAIGLNLLKQDEIRIKAMNKEFIAAEKEGRLPVYKVAKGFDPAMSEWEFARAHQIVDSNANLNSAKSEAVFIQQLGALYSSPMNMSPTRKIMFAMFMLRVDRKLKEYRDVMGRVALSYNNKTNKLFNGHITLEEIDGLVAKYKDHTWAVKTKALNAYQTTFLVSLLSRARVESGVLASADFIWLRPTDRPLWYALNGEGRRVSFVEAAGIRAHWLAEISVKRKLETPIVIEAVNALRSALISQPEITQMEE